MNNILLHRERFPSTVILEIKAKGAFPHWLEQMAREYDLKMVPNSKYASAIEHTQHALFM